MKKLALSLILLLVIAPAAFAANGNGSGTQTLTYTGSLSNNGNGNGFGSFLFSLNSTTNQGTLKANTNGLGTITGISLYQGSTLVQSFTDTNNQFRFGQFARTLALDPALMQQIQANPQNFSFVITTTDQPLGAIRGNLNDMNTQTLGGTLSGSNLTNGSENGSGNDQITLTPLAGGQTFQLHFDLTVNGIGNTVSSVALTLNGAQSPLVTFANNQTTNAGRLIGTTTITAAQAQQLLANPSNVMVTVNTPQFANGAIAGTLGPQNEIFIPVAGSAHGINGSNFQTDLNILNITPSSTAGARTAADVEFFPDTASTTTAPNASTINIGTLGSSNSRDIGSSLFPGTNGIGAMRIVSSGNLMANARIYNNQVSSGQGTFGQFVSGLARSQSLMQGALFGLTVSTAANSGLPSSRTNVGLLDPNTQPVTVTLELRDSTGAVIATRTLTLQPYQLMQVPLTGANGLFPTVTSDVPNGTVDFIAGAPIFVYGSVIDNQSGDGSFINAQDTSQFDSLFNSNS